MIKKGKHNIKEPGVVRVATEVSYFFGYKEHRNKSTIDSRRIQLTAEDVLVIKLMRSHKRGDPTAKEVLKSKIKTQVAPANRRRLNRKHH